MSAPAPSHTALRVSELSQNADHSFALVPDAGQMQQIALDLGLLSLRKLRFEGALRPTGRADWRLEAHLGATIVQPCVVTLDPVTTRIDDRVERLFLRDYQDPDAPEAEMPEDDTVDALGDWIDPWDVMVEAISIAAPDFPRKEGAALGQVVHTEPGQTPMTDEDARPFAGLADLKKSLESGQE